MTMIADVGKKMLEQLSKQAWTDDFDVTRAELRPLVKRLLVHVFGEDDLLWADPDAPVVPTRADLRRISSLLGNLQKLRRGMDKSKDVLDPLARALKAESPSQVYDSLSASLEPLLDELDMACSVALHPLRHVTRRGAPQKKAQEALIKGIAQLVKQVLARHWDSEGGPSKAEVARVAAEVVRLVNVRVSRKRVQHLIGRPI